MNTRPQAQRMRPPRQARLVQVVEAKAGDYPTLVAAMGTVRAAREVTLNPEVAGVITRIGGSVVPGGLVEEGKELFVIDSRDYEVLVQQRESELARAELALRLEAGNQSVAQAEYNLLGELIAGEDADLVLRRPHLANAQSAVDAAAAALEKARLDVRRCTILAPFNATIMEKHVDVGARVGPTTPLLRLVGTDEYWIEAKVSVDDLGWIEIPRSGEQGGSAVGVLNPAAWGTERRREGRVLRLMGEVERAGRLSQVLVSVKDPLGIDSDAGEPVLLNGSYVRMEIEGRKLTNVIAIDRQHLRDGDNVWVMNDADELEIRPVTVRFRGRDTVYVWGGIKEGDRIVTTDMGAAVEGMPLRLPEGGPGQSKTTGGGRKQP